MSKIRGEYWIQDGQVDFADGDIGDYGHEAIASNHFAHQHVDELIDIAQDLDLNVDFHIDEQFPAETTNKIRNIIIKAVEDNQIPWNSERTVDNVDDYLMKQLGVNDNEYHCIFGDGDARSLVIEKEGWIAVRSNNVELYEFNNEKKKYLIDGIDDILESEGINDPDEQIEISIFDYKTRRSWDVNLEELRNTNSIRPVTLPNTTYNKPLFVPSNKPKVSKTIDARTRSLMNTSESVNERTLYHGTIIDNESDIRKFGLVGGWHGPVGSFVDDAYRGDYEGIDPTEKDEIVFATDKKNMKKAVNAMVHHISKKLNKDFHDVSDNDIRNHGLLVIIKDSDLEPYSYDKYQDDPPRGVEPGDYYDSSMGSDLFLKGPALIRHLKRYGQWPRNWGKDSGERKNLTTAKNQSNWIKNKTQGSQKILGFKEWLVAQESTTTSSVAVFARPIGSIVRRNFPVLNKKKEKKIININMKSFNEWLESNEDLMSKLATSSKGDHGTYQTKMFSRYPYKPSEEKVVNLVEKGRKNIQDLIVVFEGLSGYHNNDNIIKTFDDFLNNLRQNGVVF